MFVLKIIVISSAILNIGFSATQCNPNNVIEFTCLGPECKVEDGVLVGRIYTNPKSEVNVLGYNTDSYFVEQNKKFSIRPQQSIHLVDYSTLSSWKYHVSIHNETYKICKPINVNQSNEESYNDNNAQIIKNTEEYEFQTSDQVRSKDPGTNNFDKNNETDRLNSTDDEDIDEIVQIESEDELNLDISSKQDLSTVGGIITRSPLTDSLSANRDQNSNFKPVEQQNDLNEKIDQNIITKPTSPNKLENDSSTECSLSSCGENKFEENIVSTTDKPSKNISPVNEENLYSKKTDPKLDTPQNQNVENTVDILKETGTTLPSQDSSKIPGIQDNDKSTEELTSNITKYSANKIEPQVPNSSIDNNNFQGLKPESDHQMKNDPSPNTPQHQNVENTVDILKETDNILPSQDSGKVPAIQDNYIDTDELTSNITEDSASKIEPQVPNSSIDNNNFQGLKPESDHQMKNDPSPYNPQHQNVESIVDILKETDNTLPSQDSGKIPVIQDNYINTDELTSNTTEDSASKIEPQVPNSSIDNNNFQGLKSESDHQIKTDPLPNASQHKNVESPVDILKDSDNTLPSQDSSKIPEIQNNFEKIQNENLQQHSSSLETITQANHQSAIDNSIKVSSSTKEEVERINESDKVDNFSKDLDGDNLQDYYNTSEMNETQKQPEIYKTVTESEHQNVSESTTYNNDQINSATPSSPTQDLMNTSDIVPSTDNQKPSDQCASEGGCLPLLDSNHKYDIEKSKPENKISHETVYKTVEPNNNEQLKDPKSFVASFGHPDTCIGVNCLKFNRNVEKVIKSPPIIPIQKQTEQDETSHSANTDSGVENKNIINEITEQSHVEMSFFDLFQNWISSPTTNSINFLSNIFGEHSNEYNDVYHDQTVENQKMFQNVNHSELYFIVVAVITLLFSLVYYKHQKGTYENHLLTLLATKDQSLLIIEKELSLLKELSSGSMISTTEKNSEVETLNEHLTKSEDIISSQALRIDKLEQEVEELTESGMEMHTLLSSALESSSKNTEKLNSLKSKLLDSENLIATLTQKNFDKTTELEKKNDILKSIQITVDELTIKNTNLVEDNARISLQQEQIIAKNMQKESKLLDEISNLQYELDRQTSSVTTAENEVLLSKDALQEMASQKFNPADAKKFLSSVKLSAELKSAKQMCEGYKHKLNESLKLNQQHLDHIDVLKSDIANLENKLEKLERKNEESINKLNILTHFFKDQEKDYLRQINEKAVLCVNKEGESSSLNERIQSQNQEIANYKSEIQSLKKEITDQEASFKIQISAADKKASDCWISFRQAERKLKEMELETAQLRNKLTMVDKKLENGAKSIDSSKDFEDELLDIPLPTVSPDFTLLSLLDFEPPPPILTNQRLPPLGALGQASSPPLPLSRRHNRSLSPGSPPPSQRSSVFRPLPQRYTYMDRQNSLGHSVESLDK